MSVTATGRPRRGRLLWTRHDGAHLDEEWRLYAACRSFDPEWWTSTDNTFRGQAIFICQEMCPVRDACHRWADQHRDLAGNAVYGGVYWSTKKNTSQARPRPQQPKPVQPGAGPAACGTPAAARRHRNRGEEPCQPCTEAERAYERDRKRVYRGSDGRPDRPCGTIAAYGRHRKHGEPPCEACADARRQYDRQRHARLRRRAR